MIDHNNKKIVTRFAPSPTGLLHMGNYRTAVFAYLFARKNDGEFILRIEDTDRERSKKEYEENILESMKWLGLSYDKFFRQSENLERHTFYLNKLIEEGKAYISKEEAKDGSGVIKEIIRFKNPNKVVVFNDLVRGEIKTDTTDLKDFVIAKSITEPLFHLAVVVDDNEEGVTHIIRGEDHIPNTPRQMLIQEALGFPHPNYAHLPLVLSADRTKLSKRKGALPVTDYRDRGYLPSAILNFMTLIGFNPGGEKEIFTLDELVNVFDVSKIHKGGAVLNEEKLNWINKEHIKLQPEEGRFAMIKKYFCDYNEETLKKLQAVIVERITHYGELSEIVNEFSYFKERETPSLEKLLWKEIPKENIVKHLEYILSIINTLDFSSVEKIKEVVYSYANSKGKGEVLSPLRVALSTRDKSPDPFTLIYVLGKEESVVRIRNAIKILST